MIEVENTDVNIVRNLIPMRNHMPASAYGLKAISDWFRSMQALCWVCVSVQLGQCAAKMWPQFLEMEDKVVLERIFTSDKVSLKFGEVEVAPTTKD